MNVESPGERAESDAGPHGEAVPRVVGHDGRQEQ
jgi:hypothetical protein